MPGRIIDKLRLRTRLWDLFTRQEEYDPRLVDRFGRYPYFLSENRNIFSPEVSAFLSTNGLLVEYPNSAPFAVCLSHDVDYAHISAYAVAEVLARGLRDRDARTVREMIPMALGKLTRKLNPFWNFGEIMDLEQNYEAKSSFYFLALEPGNTEFSYHIGDLAAELRMIVKRGWEVGLHGGPRAPFDSNALAVEKHALERVLGRTVIGYRSHMLRFVTPSTWKILRDAGFQYDSTFGHADCVGFRNGMCHPFIPFDLDTSKPIEILEIPLVIMDATLDRYMHLAEPAAWKLTTQLIERVKECRGVISILWHNTSLTGSRTDFYKRILSYCHENEAWITSGEQVWRWWTSHNFSSWQQ